MQRIYRDYVNTCTRINFKYDRASEEEIELGWQDGHTNDIKKDFYTKFENLNLRILTLAGYNNWEEHQCMSKAEHFFITTEDVKILEQYDLSKPPVWRDIYKSLQPQGLANIFVWVACVHNKKTKLPDGLMEFMYAIQPYFSATRMPKVSKLMVDILDMLEMESCWIPDSTSGRTIAKFKKVWKKVLSDYDFDKHCFKYTDCPVAPPKKETVYKHKDHTHALQTAFPEYKESIPTIPLRHQVI